MKREGGQKSNTVIEPFREKSPSSGMVQRQQRSPREKSPSSGMVQRQQRSPRANQQEPDYQTKGLISILFYSQFHKTLPKSSLQMHGIPARFYEMGDGKK